MKKKKLMKILRKTTSGGPLRRDFGLPSREGVMEDHSEAQFVVYRIKNGYSVLAIYHKRDTGGSRRTHTEIQYVSKVEEIPALIASFSAASKMDAI